MSRKKKWGEKKEVCVVDSKGSWERERETDRKKERAAATFFV
jgi:hypothetical protein